MKKYEIKVHEISKDGLPHMETMRGRVAFIFNDIILSGWPVETKSEEDIIWWKTNYTIVTDKRFSGITHWVEFPFSFFISILEDEKIGNQI